MLQVRIHFSLWSSIVNDDVQPSFFMLTKSTWKILILLWIGCVSVRVKCHGCARTHARTHTHTHTHTHMHAGTHTHACTDASRCTHACSLPHAPTEHALAWKCVPWHNSHPAIGTAREANSLQGWRAWGHAFLERRLQNGGCR